MRKTNKQTIKTKCYNYIIGKGKQRAVFECRRGMWKEEAEAGCFVGVFGLESVKIWVRRAPHTPLSPLQKFWLRNQVKGLGGCGELQSQWVEP